ncbi:MAG: arginine N-succinyltransferase [Sphingomonadales bacterium]|nr:arginine N-succinyltransferase [Sphingomonadales bacterium]
MNPLLRPAGPQDLPAIYAMAKRTGGGFTNLPPDRRALKAKLERSAAAFARAGDTPDDDQYVFMLEARPGGPVIGTCQVFAKVGSTWPFYSYRRGAISQTSKALGRSFRAEMLSLCTDLDGTTEVGGLYLLPDERSAGTGALLARSRYLFIAMHRPRFADRTIAELRGAHDETGGSPFWDGVAGRFFGMTFREADEFNAVHGNQFIADLMPKHPLYLAMLPESAIAAIGVPHNSGRAAMRMLENEGFTHDHYLDIFDGGPTMCAPTDRIATVAKARTEIVAAIREPANPVLSLAATGHLASFRTTFAHIEATPEGLIIDPQAAAALSAEPGTPITHVPR